MPAMILAPEKPCRTLTGAWIETVIKNPKYAPTDVAPSRVRGLKLRLRTTICCGYLSHPHGCVD